MKNTITIFKLILAVFLYSASMLPSYAATENEASRAIDIVEYSVNVNTANADEMATLLKGIGAKKAQAIIEYREEHGPFTDIAQLTSVKGIGPSFITKNRDNISVK